MTRVICAAVRSFLSSEACSPRRQYGVVGSDVTTSHSRPNFEQLKAQARVVLTDTLPAAMDGSNPREGVKNASSNGFCAGLRKFPVRSEALLTVGALTRAQ